MQTFIKIILLQQFDVWNFFWGYGDLIWILCQCQYWQCITDNRITKSLGPYPKILVLKLSTTTSLILLISHLIVLSDYIKLSNCQLRYWVWNVCKTKRINQYQFLMLNVNYNIIKSCFIRLSIVSSIENFASLNWTLELNC